MIHIRVEKDLYPYSLSVYVYLRLFRFEPDIQLLIFLALAHPWARTLLNRIGTNSQLNYRIQLIKNHGYTQEEALEYDPIPF